MRQQSIHMLPGENSAQRQCKERTNVSVLTQSMEVSVFAWEMITLHLDDGREICVDLSDLEVREAEKNTVEGLIRGVAAAYAMRDVEVKGFELEMQAKSLPGNGLTTYYGFALLIAGVINEIFCERRFTPAGVSEIARYAETVCFGEQTNQVDLQMASVSGIVFIDSSSAGSKKDEFISFCFNDSGLQMCVIDRVDGGEYSSGNIGVTSEDIREACEYFGKKRIADVDEEEFFRELPNLRGSVSDQSIFSAVRTYLVKREAQKKLEALENRDFDSFVHLTAEDDKKVWIYLQD